MNLPKDPVMLLSVINTALRDKYASLEELCGDNEIDIDELTKKIACINYEYDASANQFK
ncbi:MAG: DUF4250 domain-containing protein [Pseudobutyrivibrio sp.]|mgnify:CR=1 FL=1|nr:DUF4250 domain-containing protein [Pseudobutyrivibrio sp.]